MSHQHQDTNLLPSSSSSDGGQSSSMERISVTSSFENRTRSHGTRFYPKPKPRFKWSADLQRRFLEAVAFLGGEKRATPKTVLELLDEKELTLSQVRSHLQIHRTHCYEQQQLAREAEAEAAAAAAQMAWTASVHNQPQGYPYGHQLYSAPPPQSPLRPPQQLLPPPRPARLYIDPVGPMPPSIPPSMRMMDYSASQPKTIVFKKLFPKSKSGPVNDEENNETPEPMSSDVKILIEGSCSILDFNEASSSARNEIQDDVSLDLTLSTKPARP